MTNTKIAVSIQEAAQICGVGKSSIYRLISSGKLKKRKMGRRALILIADLKDYMNSLEEG